MKSSTIRRSTLSKESMEVIETLAKEQEQEGSLGEYVRPDEAAENNVSSSKSQEIDLLWQTFKATQFNTNSPTAYILLGFVIGVLTTLIIGAVFVMGGKSHAGIDLNKFRNNAAQEQTLEQQTEVSVSDNTDVASEAENSSANASLEENSDSVSNSVEASNMTKYIVKSGDTVEGIIIRNYGSYSPEKAEMIMKANNLESLDRLQIDQELLIPAP